MRIGLLSNLRLNEEVEKDYKIPNSGKVLPYCSNTTHVTDAYCLNATHVLQSLTIQTNLACHNLNKNLETQTNTN